jgi:hypothetical protein
MKASVTTISVALLEQEVDALIALNELRPNRRDRYLINGLRIWLEEMVGRLKRGLVMCQPIPPRGNAAPVKKGGHHGK